MNVKRWLVVPIAALSLASWVQAQVGTAVSESGKAVSQSAQQAGDEAKAAVSSEPDKAIDKSKARAHKASAQHHAHRAKAAVKSPD